MMIFMLVDFQLVLAYKAPAMEEFAPIVDMPLDPGIRQAVLALRSGGIETYESCDGGPGHAFAEPTVRFYGNAWEGMKAFSVAMTLGLPVLSVRRIWEVNDGALEGPWWEMTFRRMDPPAERSA